MYLNNKVFLSKAIWKKNKGWKFASVSQGRIFTWTNKNSDTIQITPKGDLSRAV